MDIQINSDEKLNIVNENITLVEKKDGLTFGTDAFLLASFIKQQKNAVALELGCGTGIISLLLIARNKVKSIDCIDIQNEFVELTKRNIKINGFEDRIKAHCVNVKDITNDLIKNEVDIVFSNPPYMKVSSGKRNEHDIKFIARHETDGDINDFCKSASKILKFGGYFYAVYRPDRLMDLFCSLRKNNLEPKELLFVHSNLDSTPSMVLVQAKKGASSSLKLLPPLYINDENGKMTAKAKEIYDTCEIKR